MGFARTASFLALRTRHLAARLYLPEPEFPSTTYGTILETDWMSSWRVSPLYHALLSKKLSLLPEAAMQETLPPREDNL